ncbi:MAG: M4 family metallopeptidase [Thermoanaerobaculales bacterium]|jgi:Zn-dependent metalloprotease|nr:M4 family metallopeptidase [Thermoanaerobaculales bacterium]
MRGYRLFFHRPVCSALFAVIAVIPLAAAGTGDDVSALTTATRISSLVTDPATGNPQYLRFASAPPANGVADTAVRARSVLVENRAILGIDDPEAQLRLVDTRTDPIGGNQAVFQQVHHGLPVFGTLIRVHFDSAGALTTVNGSFVSEIDLDPVPLVDAADAETSATRIMAKEVRRAADALDVNSARLLVYRTNLVRGFPGENHLAWEVEVACPPHVREVLYIDAHDGGLLDRRSEIHHLHRSIHLGSYPHVIWSEGDPLPYADASVQREAEVNELIAATGDAHALFRNITGGAYLSFDGDDAVMNAIYDADDLDCPNAQESNGFTAYCTGMVSDDVVAHEWTHAYTEWTHSLVYQWQPGALNEAYSDIYGELVDLINGRGTDSPGGVRPPESCSVYGGSPRPAFFVNSPAPLSGAYPVGGAVFNPPQPWTVTADVELVDDGSGLPSDACETIAGFTPGSIALIDRGNCYFRDKVVRAAAAGAVGVIVINNQGDDIIDMGGDPTAAGIPAVFLGGADGERLKGALDGGVNATLTLDGSLTGSFRWLIGEDTAELGAMRDMWSPTCFGDPGRVGSGNYHCHETDNGGVHTNSGVPNHAFALLVDGGSFNGRTIGAIGATRAARIFWRAMSVYQTPVTGFRAHADLLEASCRDLIGQPLYDPATGTLSSETIRLTDCDQVAAAMAAVEMRDNPVQCNFDTLLDGEAPPLPGNIVVFSELFDTDPGDAWELSNSGVYPEYSPRDWIWTEETPGGDGGAFFALDSVRIGDCQPGSDDQSGVMRLTSPPIIIPQGTIDSLLAFDHWMASEAAWDGGNVKLSVNNGPFFAIPSSQFLHNPYNARINSSNSNPLAGEWAWTGTDQGTMSGSWGQTQITLAPLVQAGDIVSIRFDLGVDGCNGAHGWYVDNVKVLATGASARRGGGRVTP